MRGPTSPNAIAGGAGRRPDSCRPTRSPCSSCAATRSRAPSRSCCIARRRSRRRQARPPRSAREPSDPTRTSSSARCVAASIAQLDRFYEPELGGWGKRAALPWPLPGRARICACSDARRGAWRERALSDARVRRASSSIRCGAAMYQYSIADWDHPHYEKITAIQAGAIATYRDRRPRHGRRAVARACARGDVVHADVHARCGRRIRDEPGCRPPPRGCERGARQCVLRRVGCRAPRSGMPRIDTAVYADLNGLMIHALCELYAATLDAEVLAWPKVRRSTSSPSSTADGALTHGAEDDPAGVLYLRDQAAMGRAFLALHRVTGDRAWSDRARARRCRRDREIRGHRDRRILRAHRGPRSGRCPGAAPQAARGEWSHRALPA